MRAKTRPARRTVAISAVAAKRALPKKVQKKQASELKALRKLVNQTRSAHRKAIQKAAAAAKNVEKLAMKLQAAETQLSAATGRIAGGAGERDTAQEAA